MLGIPAIDRLFVILDVFSRDSLYKDLKQVSNTWWRTGRSINFHELKKEFRRILNEVPINARAKILRNEKTFDAYKIHIVDFLGINSGYSDRLQENHAESAKLEKTLLFFATSQPIPQQKPERKALKEIIQLLAKTVPSTISSCPMQKSNGEDSGYGPSPLHLMIVKETNSKQEQTYKRDILKDMLEENKMNKNPRDLDNDNLNDVVSKGHLLKGKTILNIAARTLNIDIIKLLLENGVSFNSCNNYSDNMYHSLVRYAMIFPEKKEKVIETMEQIELFLNGRYSTDKPDFQPESLWRMKNYDQLTPLQLAAKHGQFELFRHILRRKVSRPYC